MKNIFSLFVTILVTTSLWAYDFQSGELYYTITSSSEPYTVEVTDAAPSITTATIPENVTYNGTTYSVTSIGDEAFWYCSYLKSITIPNSVTSIGNTAFSRCSSLTAITIPNSVTSIGYDAFAFCTSLASITIGNSVTSIGGYVFEDCSSLKSITCEAETPPTVGSYAFYSVSTSIPVYVPCGCVGAYEAAYGWKAFTNIQGPQAEYSIIVSTSNSQMGTAQVDKNNACGCNISATPKYGYHFMQWSDGNTDNPRTLVLTQDTVLTAEFAINQYMVTSRPSHNERGTTQGDTTANYLENITISATANYGYHFTQWNDGNTSNPRQVQVKGDKTYTAYFDKNTYHITKNYDSNQGYINGSSSGEYLDNITLTAEPNYGYHFMQWSDGVTNNPRTLVLTQDTTLTAEFTPNQYSITTNSKDPERGTTQGDTTANYLENITISATANYGYHFTQWNDGSTSNPRQVQVKGDKTYTAYFDKNTYYISLTCNNDQGQVEGPTSAEYLDEVTISATANCGYHFVQWSDGNTDNPRTLVLTQDTVLTAEFAQSFSGRCGDSLYWELVDDTLHITGSGEMYNYNPDTAPWKLLVSSSKTLTIAEDVTMIGNDAFDGCTALESIVWNAVKEVKQGITIKAKKPNHWYSQITAWVWTTASDGHVVYPTYENGWYVVTVNTPTINIIFRNGTGWTGDSNQTVDLFYNENVYLELQQSGNKKATAQVKNHLGSPFFDIRSQIKSFTFGDAVERIPAYLCCGMDKLTSITIPSSVTSIGDYAFYGCSALTSVTIPNSVTSSGDYAFYGCSSLTSITIPNSVTSIGEAAFAYCSALTSIIIPNSVTSIRNYAFYGCSALTSVTIPESVTSIGGSAFYGCSSLTFVTVPESVTSIGKSAFEGCSALESVVWNVKNCANASSLETAPFYGITSQIKSFTFGEAVENVPAYLCYGMEKLTNVSLPIKVKTIGTSAFEGCVRLGKISLGTGLEEIAANAFAGCTRLYDIYCYAVYPPFVDESSFANYNAYLYVPCDSKRDYTLDPVWGKFQNIECLSDEPTDIENIETPLQSPTNVQKFFRNGQLIIVRDGKTYTTMGAEIE